MKLFIIFSFSYLVCIVACSPAGSPSPPPVLSSDKKINAVVFKNADNPGLSANATGVISGDTIKFLFPVGTVVTSLIPDISFSGKTISPANRVAQNFTNPVSYTVTAEDGSNKTFVIVVNVETAEATLFIASSHIASGLGSIYAINPETGMLKWKYVSNSNSVLSSIQFYNRLLYTSIGKNITAFDSTTKTIKWQYPVGAALYSTPMIKNGILYINCDDNYLYAVNAITGTLVWKFFQDAVSSLGGNYSSPTVVDDVVYVGSLNGYVYAINANTGTLKWKVLLSSPIQSSPSVVNNVLYITDVRSGSFYALNTVDGSIKWTYNSFNGVNSSSPTVVNGVVYACSYNGTVHAIDVNTGIDIWKYATHLNIMASPIVVDGVLYVGADYGSSRNFYAINTNNGTLKWTTATETSYFSSAVVFGGMVYVGTWPDLLAFDINNGALKWKFSPPTTKEQFWSSPCVVDKQGNVFLSTLCGSKD